MRRSCLRKVGHEWSECQYLRCELVPGTKAGYDTCGHAWFEWVAVAFNEAPALRPVMTRRCTRRSSRWRSFNEAPALRPVMTGIPDDAAAHSAYLQRGTGTEAGDDTRQQSPVPFDNEIPSTRHRH